MSKLGELRRKQWASRWGRFSLEELRFMGYVFWHRAANDYNDEGKSEKMAEEIRELLPIVEAAEEEVAKQRAADAAAA